MSSIIYTTYGLLPSRFGSLEVTFATFSDYADPYSSRVRNSWHMEGHYILAAELLRPGDTFIDAGANIGTFAFPVAKLSGSEGILVEALPENCDLLRAAAIRNGDASISIVNAAVGGEEGEIFIAGSSAYAKTSNTAEGGGIRVKQVPLSTLLEHYNPLSPRLLKIDVEGSELETFEGARDLLASRRIPYIIYESNGPVCQHRNYSVRDLRRALSQLGYEIFTIVGRTLVPTDDEEFQFLGNADLFATMEGIPEKISFEVAKLSNDRKIKSVVHTLTNMPPQYRDFILNELELAPDEIKHSTEVRQAMMSTKDTV
ncbi:FkbM family methyltransferase [Parvularcula dongshanensis]|uniref:FkbM family methyltransferase n=1 Tax=Parvularcula dongshanensis TaxID=1173995 RepID=A0A840I420_9PROT|nr:FkbM family methyltransferase [Parvularcula dongshanensis]MBB4658944.1 FkbM family methyltransferase [Parvularcula dongshanensis]